MLSTLPPEVVGIVLANVDDRTTLFNILVISRQFSLLAERFLYAEIVFKFEPPPNARRRLELLYGALEASDWRRAAYIQFLSSSFDRPLESRILIEKILMKAFNLKALCLYSPDNPLPHFSRQQPPIALTRFYGVFRYLDPEMSRFLGSHTSLKEIDILLMEPSETRPPVFSPTSFPNLKSLIVDARLILPFLCTAANVRNIRVNRTEEFPPYSKQDQARMASVRVLSCRPTSANRSLAVQLPNLEWLELLEHPGDLSAPMKGFWREKQTLRGIRIANRVVPSPSDGFRSLFDDIPILEFIEYRDVHHGTFKRFYRNALSPMSVRWLCNVGDEWLANWERDVVVAPLGNTVLES